MVRVDPTGALGAVLCRHADSGDRLFRRGKRVSDRSRYCAWLGELLAWRAVTTESLASEFDQEVVEEFLQEPVCERAAESWRRTLNSQMSLLRDEVEFLDSLQSTLMWQGLERRCRFERMQQLPDRPSRAGGVQIE